MARNKTGQGKISLKDNFKTRICDDDLTDDLSSRFWFCSTQVGNSSGVNLLLLMNRLKIEFNNLTLGAVYNLSVHYIN